MNRNPLACALIVGLAACTSPTSSQTTGARESPIPVEVEAVRRAPISQSLSFLGELAAPETVELASQLGGRLRTVRVHMGEAVERGALLAQVDDAELRAQYQEAEAALEMAQASFVRAQVEDENAALELARKEPLADQDLITRQELDNVRTRRNSSAAALQVAKAQISQAQARIRLLAQQLDDARITAPFSGWVAARHLDAGAVVSPGTPILQLVRTDPIVVRFSVSEREVGRVRRRMAQGGLGIQLELDAYAGETFQGLVARVAPAIAPQNRAAPIEAEVPNADGRLMPGMYGRVALELGTREDALLVPLRALVEAASPQGVRGGARSSSVFVVRQDVANRVAVVLGVERDEVGEVLDGLEAGDLVVVQGQSRLHDGARVQVVTKPTPPAGSDETSHGDASSETVP